MIAHRFAIVPGLTIRAPGDLPVQLKFPRDDGLGKITFTDEVGHHADLTDRFRIEQEPRITQTWLFLPKRALNFREKFPSADFNGMAQCRRARVRVDRRAMAHDEERGIWCWTHADQKTSNAQRRTSNIELNLLYWTFRVGCWALDVCFVVR